MPFCLLETSHVRHSASLFYHHRGLLSGCQAVQQSAVNLFEALGGEPFDGVHLVNRYSKLPHPAALSTFAPAGTPDGAYAITHSQTGLTLKSRVQAGRFVDAVDVYYPNGRLQSHTPIANGQVYGWSQGYAPDGALRSRIYYERGQATRWEQYDAHGNKTAHGDFAP